MHLENRRFLIHNPNTHNVSRINVGDVALWVDMINCTSLVCHYPCRHKKSAWLQLVWFCNLFTGNLVFFSLSRIWLLRYLLFVLTDPCLTCCIWSTGYTLLPEIHISPVSPLLHVIHLIHPITMKKAQHVPLLYLELFCLQRSSVKNYVFKKSFPLYSFVQVCTFPFEFKTHISPSVYECFSCPRAKLEELRRPHHTP